MCHGAECLHELVWQYVRNYMGLLVDMLVCTYVCECIIIM